MPPHGRDKNVPSGTCVDHEITGKMENVKLSEEDEGRKPEDIQIFTEVDADGYDFILTAHGGLKVSCFVFANIVQYHIILLIDYTSSF